MIKIPLTNSDDFAIVDNEFSNLADWRWREVKLGTISYAARDYKKDDKTWRVMFLHHAIIGQPLNRKLDTDHRNGHGFDNQATNLRHVTRRENLSNQKRRREGKTSSSFVGVYWNKKKRKWYAQINNNGNQKYIGSFGNEIGASRAYQDQLESLKVRAIG